MRKILFALMLTFIAIFPLAHCMGYSSPSSPSPPFKSMTNSQYGNNTAQGPVNAIRRRVMKRLNKSMHGMGNYSRAMRRFMRKNNSMHEHPKEMRAMHRMQHRNRYGMELAKVSSGLMNISDMINNPKAKAMLKNASYVLNNTAKFIGRDMDMVQRESMIRYILFGGNKTIGMDLMRQTKRIEMQKRLIEEAMNETTNPVAREYLKEYLNYLNEYQKAVQSVAEKQIRFRGLLGWLFGR